jgi:cation diffusion facilitator CzcD-associated flavoprotein CzcO
LKASEYVGFPYLALIRITDWGASATQFVPELVKSVGPKGKVTQHVRSSHWWTKIESALELPSQNNTVDPSGKWDVL